MTIALPFPAPGPSRNVPAVDTPENLLVTQACTSAVTSDIVAATSMEALQATGIAVTPADAAQPGSPFPGQSSPPANGWSPAGILASGWARLLPGLKATNTLPGPAPKRLAQKWRAQAWV